MKRFILIFLFALATPARGDAQCVFRLSKTGDGVAGAGPDAGDAGGVADATGDVSQKAAAGLGRVSGGSVN